MIPFVHLHVHSQYSVFDGLAPIEELVDKAVLDGMPGMAITDHGNMMGIKNFIDYVAKINKQRKEESLALFKPIIGCEMFVRDDSMSNHRIINKGNHLTILAKNRKGYQNLIHLVSLSWTEGFRFRPQISRQQLKDYSEGLIVCSGCLGGEVPSLILSGEINKAEETILWFKEVFGDDYYLEIQRHKTSSRNSNHYIYAAQQEVAKCLIDLGNKHSIKVVATNDVHFLDEDDADAHDHLVCIGTGQSVNDPQNFSYTKQEWLKSTAEMNDMFADLPQCLENNLEILDKVELFSIEHTLELSTMLPDGVENADEYLRQLVYEGAHRRWGGSLTSEQKSRIDDELNLISKAGFSGYFLILHDLVCAACERGVRFGPGRGSAAGSAVCYCLGITQVDPLKFNLLFERFLNPERPLFPDIDLDLDDNSRDEVISYLIEKYGRDRVAGLITVENMSVNNAIISVAKTEGLSSSAGIGLAQSVISRLRQGDGWYNRLSLKISEKYLDLIEDTDVSVRNTLKYAAQIENTICGTGVHACGVVIGKEAIDNYAPLCTTFDKFTGRQIIVTQYGGINIEDTGLLKLDFVGLKTLTIIKDTLNAIKNNYGIEVDINNIPLDDPKTYQLYSDGRTNGTFLFDYEGMQHYLQQLQPQKFDELVTLNALYRPGPLEYIPEYIKRKHGCEPVTYDIPQMGKYLDETYGVLVYQEQMMLLSQLLAGFTPGESDTLRKVMGKKHIEKMTAFKSKFIDGGQRNGYNPKVLNNIWSDWEKFASYAFNKSHATCYTLIAYQTAWLKANYPKEYLTVALSHTLDDEEQHSEILKECEALGINP